MKILRYFFEALVVYILFFIGKVIGLNLSRKFFSFFFQIFGSKFRSTKIIMKNFEKFSKELTENERKKIIQDMWSNYGKTFIEYIFLNKFRKNQNHINIKGEKILEKISKSNKPVIFISGHFANFELMSMEITKKNVNLATIYRPLNNLFLNPFMEYLRKKYVCNYQIKKGMSGVKEAVNYINKNFSVALMIDQRVSEGERVNFFNHQALTTTLPAQLALKYNLEIVPIFIKRNFENRFEMEVMEIIDSKNYNDKYKLTKKLNEILEIMVKKNPSQWIWTHNRWK